MTLDLFRILLAVAGKRARAGLGRPPARSAWMLAAARAGAAHPISVGYRPRSERPLKFARTFADGGGRTHTLLPVLDFESAEFR